MSGAVSSDCRLEESSRARLIMGPARTLEQTSVRGGDLSNGPPHLKTGGNVVPHESGFASKTKKANINGKHGPPA